MKFKVGDIVKATTDRYGITAKNNHWYGVVYECKDDSFSAYTIYSDREPDGEYWNLNYFYFEKASINEISMIYYMREHDLRIGDHFNLPKFPSKWNPYHINEDLQAVDAEGDIFEKVASASAAQEVKKIDHLVTPIATKEMTVAEIEKELGYKVKVVKG